ncbi:MAG: inositol monophosphatase [Candidatus Eremiobacteraeota bacterium]|nr:inositol monophosphatase [Candidatus Eremiobacteraeota bacterium]MCW5867954.1 inositol monophosphatase [Candidatus Eremiobacteraeota bacterium]
MQDYLHTAVRAARGAGQIILSRFGGEQLNVRHKGRIDLVTEVDLACEKELRSVISGDWPGHAILGEEEGRQGESKALWIVDPLDGTRSFAHGYPFVCVSVALEIEGRLEVGVVYDPLRDELFHALRGQGAYLNGRPIGVSGCQSLEQALLVTGFPYHLAEFDSSALFGLFRDFVIGSGGIRRDGSAALDFCYIACGRLDGYWEFFLHPWDAAAGSLIASEAGACVTNLGGGVYDIRVAEVLCCAPAIHSAMIRVAAAYLENMRALLR